MKLDVFDVPELERVDVFADQAALVVDAVVGDAVADGQRARGPGIASTIRPATIKGNAQMPREGLPICASQNG